MADEVVRLSTDREIAVARVVGEPRPAGRVNLDPGCIGVNEEVVFVVLSCGDTSFSMVDQYVDSFTIRLSSDALESLIAAATSALAFARTQGEG